MHKLKKSSENPPFDPICSCYCNIQVLSTKNWNPFNPFASRILRHCLKKLVRFLDLQGQHSFRTSVEYIKKRQPLYSLFPTCFSFGTNWNKWGFSCITQRVKSFKNNPKKIMCVQTQSTGTKNAIWMIQNSKVQNIPDNIASYFQIPKTCYHWSSNKLFLEIWKVTQTCLYLLTSCHPNVKD